VPAIAASLRFSHRATNGIRLHVAEAGPAEGRVVLLLHGFPEFWYGWRRQIGALAEAGYRVVAPDQRGYNLSDRPHGIAAYDIDALAQDILDLAAGLGQEKLVLVGHDWGATVAWWIASHHSDRLERFVALAAPHPAVWMDAIRNHPAQRKKSWYVKALRLPWLPELLLRQGNFKALAAALCDAQRAHACSAADLETYRGAWAIPGALTAMVNWYRAFQRRRWKVDDECRIKAPGLVIWGNHDRYGVPALAERSIALCERASAVYLDASHWVQHDEPERVNHLLLEFLRD